MTTTGEAAIAAARNQSHDGTRFDTGLCLQRVRMCFGVGAFYPDASNAWRNADYRHPETDPARIPRGVPVFWTGGSSGHGHIAIATGDGSCWSTDIARPGRWDKVPVDRIRQAWGLTLVGWTEDINRVRVYTPPAPLKPNKITLARDLIRAVIRKAGPNRRRKLRTALHDLPKR